MMFGVDVWGFHLAGKGRSCQLQERIARNNPVLHAKGAAGLPPWSQMVPLSQDHIVSPGISVPFLGWSLLEIPDLSPPDSKDPRGPSAGAAEPLPNTSLSLGTSQLES